MQGDWETLCSKFCLRFFPISKVVSLRKEVLNFRQLEEESYWYLLTQIEYEGFHKRTEYHCNILPGVFQVSLYFTTEEQWSKDLLSNKGISISQHTT